MHIYCKNQQDNKKGKSLLNLLINCISARSATQIWFLKDEYTFHFSNFPIIGWCHSSDNCLFGIVLFLAHLPREFFLKKLKTIEVCLSYFGFLAILNALSGNTLLEAVFLKNSLKSP